MAGEATIEELTELGDLMHENDEWNKFAEQLMINQPGTTGQDEHEADAAFAAHSVKMELSGRLPGKTVSIHGTRNLFRWTMRIAAVLIIALAGLYTFNWIGKKKNTVVATNEVTIATKKGSRSNLLLADGTTVWLNVASKLTYEKDFGKESREVSLTGEAFFDVAKQIDRPFIVHTSAIDIRVLGTAFNVKSYPDERNIEITLYRGLVEVIRQKDSVNKGIQLAPYRKLILLTNDSLIIAVIDSTEKESERFETAWLNNRLQFRNDSFVELARKLERWYDIKIDFTDEKVKQLRFSGAFEIENIEQAFSALKIASGNQFNFKINNHEIFVESSK